MTPDSLRPIINIQGLSKAYGIMPVLQNVHLTINRGEFVALLGPNGSGKSTLLRCLTGLTKPTEGKLTIGGWEMPQEAMAVRAQIGIVGHQNLLYSNLTATENLRFFARLYGISQLGQNERIPALLDQVGLTRRSRDLVRDYSRGMQQRLSIARALLHEPDVLFLDEPYTGLDQTAAASLDELLDQTRTTQQTIVMTTHQLHRAHQLTNRAVILSHGKVVHDATIDEDFASFLDTYHQATRSKIV